VICDCRHLNRQDVKAIWTSVSQPVQLPTPLSRILRGSFYRQAQWNKHVLRSCANIVPPWYYSFWDVEEGRSRVATHWCGNFYFRNVSLYTCMKPGHRLWVTGLQGRQFGSGLGRVTGQCRETLTRVCLLLWICFAKQSNGPVHFLNISIISLQTNIGYIQKTTPLQLQYTCRPKQLLSITEAHGRLWTGQN